MIKSGRSSSSRSRAADPCSAKWVWIPRGSIQLRNAETAPQQSNAPAGDPQRLNADIALQRSNAPDSAPLLRLVDDGDTLRAGNDRSCHLGAAPAASVTERLFCVRLGHIGGGDDGQLQRAERRDPGGQLDLGGSIQVGPIATEPDSGNIYVGRGTAIDIFCAL